jgi:hypothetical protein
MHAGTPGTTVALRGAMRVYASLLSILAACSSSASPEGGTVPVLEVLTPERGSTNEGGQVTVSGRVTDDSPGVRVTVNGVEAEVSGDTFTATVFAPRGIAIFETHAIDAAGNDVRDVRAVLSGTLAPSDGSDAAPIGARLGRTGLTTLGKAIGNAAEGIDFTTIAKGLNPVYNNDGCLGAKVDITSVSVGNISVSLDPKAGAVDTSVSIDNVVVRLNANFKVACIGGSTTITVRSSKARVRDDLGAQLVTGKIRTSLPSPTVTLEGFTVDVGGVPGAIENLLKDQARSGAEKAITSAIKDRVPALANDALAGVLAKPISTSLLGHDLTVDVQPSKLEITTDGLFVVTDTKILIAGGEGGMYVSTPASIVTVDHQVANLGVLIADDAANQMFAGLWAAGAFNRTFSAADLGPATALLDDDVVSLDLAPSLPPTISADESLELAIGDAIITARDANGNEVQKFALSMKTTLAAKAGTAPTLVTTTPTVFVQLLAQSDAVDFPLEATELEGILTGVWGVVDGMVNDALVKLPMPSVAGVSFEAPAVSSREGFLVVDANAQ